MSLFVDTSVWYAAADAADLSNSRAREILSAGETLVTSDHVLLEMWTLLRARIHRHAAEVFWEGIRGGVAHLECVTTADLQAAWSMGRDYRDQGFSMADRTSFAVMERLGITRAASFNSHFAVYRFGPRRNRVFQVIR